MPYLYRINGSLSVYLLMKKKNESTLTDLLKQIKEQSHLSTQLTRVEIDTWWQESMGPVVSRYTEHIQLKNRRLTITITSPALRQELFMGRAKIQQRINDHFDRIVVDEVKLR